MSFQNNLSFQENYLEDYTIVMPKTISKVNNEIILPNYTTFSNKVIKTWKMYSSFLFAVKLVLNHPSFDMNSSGTDEVLYDTNYIPNNITSFNSVDKTQLLRFIYDNVALNNLKSLIEKNSTSNLTLIGNLTIIEAEFDTITQFLISKENSFTFDNLDKVTIYTRTQTDILYRLVPMEKKFIIFILNVLNYFLNLHNTQTDETLLLNHITQIETDIIIDIFFEVYQERPSNFEIVMKNLLELVYFIIPYINKINDTFSNYGIPSYFLGITIFELLLEEKKKNLIIIANYKLSSNTSLCDITLPLFTSYYLSSL